MAKKLAPLDTWFGPAAKFTRNKHDVGRKKIVFVGASYLFVHRVLRDMLLVGGFDNCQIVVHDIDPAPMNLVADLLTRIARQKKSNMTVTRTLDRREALKGADIVVLSITTGGREADQRSWEVCLKHGVEVPVGDTMGPAALARNLRTIPVVVQLVREMEKLCPKAAMINFTNPMSALTGAMARNTSLPCWGLCHSADAMVDFMAEIFKTPKKDVYVEVGGVNHQAFVTKLLIKGKDRTKDIVAASMKSDAAIHDELLNKDDEVTLQRDVCKILGAWPSTGDTHMAEFYRYFTIPGRIGKLQHGMRGKILPGREPLGPKEPGDLLKQWAYGPRPVGDLQFLTNEHAHELMYSFLTGQEHTAVLNLLNTDGYVQGLPKDACVEALVSVKGNKVKGKSIVLPPAVHALVTNWVTIHDLSIQAALNCDRDAARQALFLDPQISDMYKIDPLLEDMLTALKPWMPKGWYAGR